MSELTPKQRRFVDEYMTDFNATQAAIRAGYSKKTAYSQGGRLLKNVEVAAEVKQRQGNLAKKFEVTPEYVIAGIRGIAEDKKNKPGDRLRGYELLGKTASMFQAASNEPPAKPPVKGKTVEEIDAELQAYSAGPGVHRSPQAGKGALN